MFSLCENWSSQDLFLPSLRVHLFAQLSSTATGLASCPADVSVDAICSWRAGLPISERWAHDCPQLLVSRHIMNRRRRHLCNLGTNLETPVRNLTETLSKCELMAAFCGVS